MRLIKYDEIFELDNKHTNKFISLENLQITFSKLECIKDGIAVISSKSSNRVISRIKPIDGLKLFQGHCISFAKNSTGRYQTKPFYILHSGVMCLRPKIYLTKREMLFYSLWIGAIKEKIYRTKKDFLNNIRIPHYEDIPTYVHNLKIPYISNKEISNNLEVIPLNSVKWKNFKIQEIMDVRTSERSVMRKIKNKIYYRDEQFNIAIISHTKFNNGVDNYITKTEAINQNFEVIAPSITISKLSASSSACYQPYEFVTKSSVNIITLKDFKMNKNIGLFICTILNKTFSYQPSFCRALHTSRLKNSIISIPVDDKGNPNFEFMNKYMAQLN